MEKYVYFYELGPLGRVSHKVAISNYASVYMYPLQITVPVLMYCVLNGNKKFFPIYVPSQRIFFVRPLIGPQTT